MVGLARVDRGLTLLASPLRHPCHRTNGVWHMLYLLLLSRCQWSWSTAPSLPLSSALLSCLRLWAHNKIPGGPSLCPTCLLPFYFSAQSSKQRSHSPFPFVPNQTNPQLTLSPFTSLNSYPISHTRVPAPPLYLHTSIIISSLLLASAAASIHTRKHSRCPPQAVYTPGATIAHISQDQLLVVPHKKSTERSLIQPTGVTKSNQFRTSAEHPVSLLIDRQAIGFLSCHGIPQGRPF
ncbi:hypothetical protein F5Y17DRAFT_325464 [Xylariaceae sp. FL0594]|nr:hypothetical protein F5Y17DRAFT_325464 [Xylariaceae sp. FL0594]